MKEPNEKLVLITEKSNVHLTVSNKQDYILEGIFAEFGKENRNNRIYEEAEYLPHLEELQAKIKTCGGFIGELDHPESFDVRLRDASHIVEYLEYNKEKRQVIGRIKLLTTDNGRIARSLIDDGVQLSISSRAAGLVGENKHVQIKKIFTYDLVADPGFENAKLKRINESFGLSMDNNIGIYDTTEMSDKKNKTHIMLNKNTPQTTSKFVTRQQLSLYTSDVLEPEFEKINKTLESLQKKVNETQTTSKQHEKYFDYLANGYDKIVEYCEHVYESVDTLQRDQVSTLHENLQKLLRYTKYLADKVDDGLMFSDYLSESITIVGKFADYLGENLEQSIDYTANHLAPYVDKHMQYSDLLGEHVTKLIEHSDYVIENIDEHIDEFKKMKRSLKNSTLNESNSDIYKSIGNNKKKDISTKVDEILDSVRKTKVDKIAEKENYNFFRLLSKDKIDEFLKLEKTKKQKVAQAISENKCFSEHDIIRVWEHAVQPFKEAVQRWILEMPDDIKPVWESLNENARNRITAQAALHLSDNSSSYAIRMFWNSRNLNKPVNESINESEVVLATDNTPKVQVSERLGYSQSYVDVIKKQVGHRFK